MILGALFVLLGARTALSELAERMGSGNCARVRAGPGRTATAVAVSVAGTGVSLREAAFLAAMAPRGIVAAATSSVFALALSDAGVAGADLLAPLTFTVIIGTGIVYGLGAGPVARRLGVAGSAPRGIALVGSQPRVVRLGEELVRSDVPVLLMPGPMVRLMHRYRNTPARGTAKNSWTLSATMTLEPLSSCRPTWSTTWSG